LKFLRDKVCNYVKRCLKVIQKNNNNNKKKIKWNLINTMKQQLFECKLHVYILS